MGFEGARLNGIEEVEAGNRYAQQVFYVAGRMREAESEGWDDNEVGPSIRGLGDVMEQSEVFVPGNLGQLRALIGETVFPEELDRSTAEVLLGAWGYCLQELDRLGLDPHEAIWMKMFVNRHVYAALLAFTEQEIMRHDIQGGDLDEGIFDRHYQLLRRGERSAERQREAYLWGVAMFRASQEDHWVDQNVGVIQLYLLDFIARMGKPFAPADIQALMLDEIAELAGTRQWWRLTDHLMFHREKGLLYPPMSHLSAKAYELCDVMILVFQMFNVYGVSVPEILKDFEPVEEALL